MTQVALGELMPSKKSSLDPRKHPDEEFELYSIPAFDAGEPELVNGADVGSSKQVLRQGDVILSKIVPHIRRAWIVEPRSSRRTIGSSEWIVFRSDKADPGYLKHLLVSDRFHQDLMQTVAGVGGSLLRARPTFVAKIEIPLPSLEEQKRIAAILDAADNLRTKRRQALTKIDTLTQAIFLDMFGDPAFNPHDLPVYPIGELLDSATYGTSKKAGPHGRYPVLRMGNLTYDGQLDLGDVKFVDLDEKDLAKHLVEQGDVLFNRTNSAELVGKTAVYRLSEPMAYAGYLVRLRTSTALHPEYLGTFMNLASTKHLLRSMCKSIVGMANINAKELQKIRIPAAPIADQERFARSLQAVGMAREPREVALTRLDDLFASLQQRAFRGEL